jgi:hypothetical protein
VNPERLSEGARRSAGDAAHRIPPLPGAARLRYVIAAVAAFVVAPVLLIGVTFEMPHGLEPPFGLWVAAILAMVPVWLPSLFIAGGLSRGRMGAVGAALIHDALILLTCGGALIWMLRGCLHWTFELGLAALWGWAAGLLGVLSAAEGSHLLRRVWSWRPAWGVFAIVALSLLAPALAGPPAVREYQASHVKPLIAYARRHWFSIPPASRISVWRLPAEARGSDHRDVVYVEGREWFSCTPTVQWSVVADHRRDGRWELCATPISEEGPVEWPVSGCLVFAASAPVESAEDARKLLQRVGVADAGLVSRPMTKQGQWDYYEFWSPTAQGFYRVAKGIQLNIQLYRKRPLVVP